MKVNGAARPDAGDAITQWDTSWGRTARIAHQVFTPSSRHATLPPTPPGGLLPRGNGRSYGDTCLNEGGALISSRRLDRFIAFDPATGMLRCESGVQLDEILRITVPQGWFPPVTPGTRFVTVGGAIANDVHGKNHHVHGTFGAHLRCFELLTSDGARRICSRSQEPELFAATIGGLGLTGLITWAEMSLRRIGNPWIDAQTLRFDNLDGFFELSARSDRDHEYTVAWIDCAGAGRRLGRGLFMRGNHAPAGSAGGRHRPRCLRLPFVPPVSVVNPLTLRAFNTLYYHRQPGRTTRRIQHYEAFFFPLDGIRDWNRMYGPRGFHQYQCVVPHTHGRAAIEEMLGRIAASGMGSFLAVLKICGDAISPGMLSFPMPGVSLALDFPNRGPRLLALFEQLDRTVMQSGGRLYPAKDGRMSATVFRAGFHRWREFASHVDPAFSSSFWRRVMEQR